MTTPPFWSPDRHRDRRPALLARGRIKRALRGWFEDQGYIEVECGALCTSPGNEAHLHAFETQLRATSGEGRTVYLHTSPEFAAKKLLAAGEQRIFEFARVFRNRERSALHAPEFTMLEWYLVGASYEAAMVDTIELVRLAAATLGVREFEFRKLVCDPFAAVQTLTVAEAFSRFAGIDLLASLGSQGEGNRTVLAQLATQAGHTVAGDDSWADIFSKLLVGCIEPRLGRARLTLLCEYPRCEAALARPSPGDPRVAERFELYACGVELANGFGELTDATEQRQRFELEMAEKNRIYGERYPLDEDFLTALQYLPPASGVALGFDRLCMLATRARSLDDVIWTPAP